MIDCSMPEKRNPAITYRPHPELRERLQRYAESERWPLTTAITDLLEKGLDEHEGLVSFKERK